MQSQDYIERMIAQLVEAIGRALGLARGGRHDEAQREIDALWPSATGLRRADVDRLDPATLRALLGGKRAAATMLLRAEAEAKQSYGDLAESARLRALAAALEG